MWADRDSRKRDVEQLVVSSYPYCQLKVPLCNRITLRVRSSAKLLLSSEKCNSQVHSWWCLKISTTTLCYSSILQIFLQLQLQLPRRTTSVSPWNPSVKTPSKTELSETLTHFRFIYGFLYYLNFGINLPLLSPRDSKRVIGPFPRSTDICSFLLQ